MKALRNERGVILMFTIILLMFLLLITGIVADFMRAFVIKRELQDALDAAVISAAQSDKAQQRSNYVFQQGEYYCKTTRTQNGYVTTCGCKNWSYIYKNNEQSTSSPESLLTGDCIRYIGEEKRWIDYNYGDSANSVAISIFNYNKENSVVVQRNAALLSNLTPTFYIYNNPTDPRYPSIAGEITTTLKTTFLTKVICSGIPINCKSQATTHYEIRENYTNYGLHKIPANEWPNPEALRTGTGGQRSMY